MKKCHGYHKNCSQTFVTVLLVHVLRRQNKLLWTEKDKSFLIISPKFPKTEFSKFNSISGCDVFNTYLKSTKKIGPSSDAKPDELLDSGRGKRVPSKECK